MGTKVGQRIRRMIFSLRRQVAVTVRWPVGMIAVNEQDPRWDSTLGAQQQQCFSSDPNDHYRPEIERTVGRQGLDWDWGFEGNNCAENRLTIRFLKKHESLASYFAMKWN